jgi:hypothetical protein
MGADRLWLAAVALALTACAAALPPAVAVREVQSLAGAYSGSMKEVSKLSRPARVVIQADGRFELTVAAPEGFRTTGMMLVEPDGSLSYEYDGVKGKGVVYEAEGRRVIVLTQAGGGATTTVDRNLP